MQNDLFSHHVRQFLGSVLKTGLWGTKINVHKDNQQPGVTSVTAAALKQGKKVAESSHRRGNRKGRGCLAISQLLVVPYFAQKSNSM